MPYKTPCTRIEILFPRRGLADHINEAHIKFIQVTKPLVLMAFKKNRML
jgi:hypothetical protein